MAAENLETTGAELGREIEVEVQAAMGAENELTAAEIAAAVSIAADTAVQRDRFEGEPLVKGTVKDAVTDPEGLVDEAAALVEGRRPRRPPTRARRPPTEPQRPRRAAGPAAPPPARHTGAEPGRRAPKATGTTASGGCSLSSSGCSPDPSGCFHDPMAVESTARVASTVPASAATPD